MDELKICKLCGEKKKLIDAHIIPRKFTPANASSYSSNFQYSKIKRPRGLIDSNILCSECDGGILSKLDKIGYDFFLDPPLEFRSYNLKYFYKETAYKNHLLHKFIYSVMWRGSISSKPDVSKANLGEKHEKRIRELLLEPGEINIYEYPIIMSYITEFPAKDKIIGMPYSSRYSDGVNYFDIIFNLYMVSIKVDKRANKLYPKGTSRILGESNKILILDENYEKSEYLRKSLASTLKVKTK